MEKERKKIKCPNCDGRGYLEKVSEVSSESWSETDRESVPMEREICDKCDGTGFIGEDEI
ncbi:MAG: hypothetical protein D6734_03445 [Candidatus Schekmanbacteria bacterium]|nr:MAG: hypothetical protein D6734_03445 [Candidatus Schekmanbacteria bacterium]